MLIHEPLKPHINDARHPDERSRYGADEVALLATGRCSVCGTGGSVSPRAGGGRVRTGWRRPARTERERPGFRAGALDAPGAAAFPVGKGVG